MRTAAATVVVLGVYAVILWVLIDVPENRGQFGDMFGGATALFSALAFAAVVWSLILQRQELGLQRDELRLQRQELKAMNDIQSHSLELQHAIELRRTRGQTIEFISEITLMHGAVIAALSELGISKVLPPDLVDLVLDTPDARGKLRTYLNELERVAAATKLGVVDLDVVDLVVGGTIVRTFYNYRPYIERVQVQAKSNYLELEWLARTIEDRRRTSD